MIEKLILNFVHSGRLFANGRSIGRLQRLLDILIIGLMFIIYQPKSAWTTSFINIPTIYIVIVITFLLQQQGYIKVIAIKQLIVCSRNLIQLGFQLSVLLYWQHF